MSAGHESESNADSAEGADFRGGVQSARIRQIGVIRVLFRKP